MGDFSEPVSEEELREFLEADSIEVRADPVFKRRLRRRLWKIVRMKLIPGRRVPDVRPTTGGDAPQQPNPTKDLR